MMDGPSTLRTGDERMMPWREYSLEVARCNATPMATPAIDFWPHFAKVWFGPYAEDSLVETLVETLAVEPRMDDVFRIGRQNDDMFDLLVALWGTRPRKGMGDIDRAEVNRLLVCIRDGWLNTPSITDGVYDHFKGGVYKVHFLAEWTGEGQDKVVVYTSLVNGMTYGRLATVWNELVLWPDSAYRPRFVKRTQVKPPSFKVPTP